MSMSSPYNKVAPKHVLKKIAAPQARKGFNVESPRRLETAIDEPEAVATALEPGDVVPVDVPPVFCFSRPSTSEASPAPLLMYLTAPCGMNGSSSPVMSAASQVLLRDGHLLELPFSL
jgi:hypothetical protein